jgi:hypothetical protein
MTIMSTNWKNKNAWGIPSMETYLTSIMQASTLTYFSTCPFGQLTKKSTCPTQSFSCPKKLIKITKSRE